MQKYHFLNFVVLFIAILILSHSNTYSATDTCNTYLFEETDSIPSQVMETYKLVDSLSRLGIKYNIISHVMKINISLIDSIYKYYFTDSIKHISSTPIQNTTIFRVPDYGIINLTIDSIYYPKPIFKSNNDIFRIIHCHTQGFLGGVNTLVWKQDCFGGVINIKNKGEIEIICLGHGYYVFSKTNYLNK